MVEEILEVHAVNMSRAGVCAQRQSDLVELLKQLKEREGVGE